MDNDGGVFLIINRQPDRKLRVRKTVRHYYYGDEPRALNADGKKAAVPGYDVGLFYTEEKVATVFPVASKSELAKIDSGYRISYFGFSMEEMAGGGVDVHNPVANMQSGIITSATDFWLSKSDFAHRFLLQHNLGATGGASGSPVFNAEGKVVGMLCAVNMNIEINRQTGLIVQRSPSAAMINFAQRVDLLRDIYPQYSE